MTSTLTQELKSKIEAASKLLFDELEDTVQQVREFKTPSIKDDYDKLHVQLLFYTETEMELSYLYRKALQLKNQVDTHLSRARDILEDAKMVALEDKGFKIPNTYSSRVETEAKLRSKTFEETHEVRIWERLISDVQYLVEVIKSYQMDAFKRRKDIDTRLKIISLQF